MRRVLMIVFALASAGVAQAQEQFLCIGTKATGFRWDGREWTNATFTVEKEKFAGQDVPEYKTGDKS